MSEEKPLIYQTIIDVMGKIGVVGKNRKNQQQNFQYRGIDDVMNELHGVMEECGLFVTPSVLHEERTVETTARGNKLFYTRLTIRFTFYAKDGSNIESVVIGEAMDSGDKASNKALSIGLKYALLQVFCIPTEEEKDPDGQTHEAMAGTPQNNASKQPRNPPAPPKPKPQLKGGDSTPEEKKRIRELLESKYDNGTPVFSKDEIKMYSRMRETEKTAAELIAFIENALNNRRPPKAETAPQQQATPDKFPEDIPWENGQETQEDIF